MKKSKFMALAAGAVMLAVAACSTENGSSPNGPTYEDGNNNGGGKKVNCVDVYHGINILDRDGNVLEVTKAIDCDHRTGLSVPLANKDTLSGYPKVKDNGSDKYPVSNVGGYDYVCVDFSSVR
jgi:hypothetical protein